MNNPTVTAPANSGDAIPVRPATNQPLLGQEKSRIANSCRTLTNIKPEENSGMLSNNTDFCYLITYDTPLKMVPELQ